MTHPSRALTAKERDWCAQALNYFEIAPWDVCERAINKTRIHYTLPHIKNIRGPRSMVAQIALYQRASGITLGKDVYIRDTVAGANGQLPLDLVVHEVAHVVQFYRDGHVSFLARYLKDYAKNLINGMADFDAYLNIPYEIEAREVESFVTHRTTS